MSCVGSVLNTKLGQIQNEFNTPFNNGGCEGHIGDLYYYERLGGYFGIRATGEVELLYTTDGLPDIFELKVHSEIDPNGKVMPMFDALYAAFSHSAGVYICAYPPSGNGNRSVSGVSIISPNAGLMPPVLRHISEGNPISGSPLFLQGFGKPGATVKITINKPPVLVNCLQVVDRLGGWGCDPMFVPDGHYTIDLEQSDGTATKKTQLNINIKNAMQ